MSSSNRSETREVVLNIHIGRAWTWGVAFLLLFAGVGAFLLDGTAADAEAGTTGLTEPRQFYLTTSNTAGTFALSACADGYHFATLWEIIDPSNLVYNTQLGHTEADSGNGPPSGVSGMIRGGSSNCSNWTSDAPAGPFASTLALTDNWSVQDGKIQDIWEASSTGCSGAQLWCVED